MIISNEDVEKIKNFTKDVKDTTKTVKIINDLNIAIRDFECTTFETIKEVSSLKTEQNKVALYLFNNINLQ